MALGLEKSVNQALLDLHAVAESHNDAQVCQFSASLTRSSSSYSSSSSPSSSSSSSSCEATAVIVLVILSVYGGSAAQQQQKCFGLRQSGGP